MPSSEPAENPYALAAFDKRIRNARNFMAYHYPKAFDLFIRNGSSLPLAPNEAKNPRRSQHLQPLLIRGNHAHESIAAEHRDFYLDPPVAPPADLAENREESTYAFLFKERSDALFVPRHGVNGIPVLLQRSAMQRRKLRDRFELCRKTGHGFALSVPFLL